MRSPDRFIQSFGHALRGLAFAFRSQFNLRFHVFAALLVITAGFYFVLDDLQWIAILLCIGSVIGTELINSSIEYQVDLVSPERNEKAGRVKDMAAAAVLVVALLSAVIGLIIFIPRIIERWS